MIDTIPLRKLLIELRYKPDIRFYGKMDELAIHFAEKFPDWERSPLTVEIRNIKKHRRVYLAHRRCFFESDLAAREINIEFDLALSTLDRILNVLSIDEFNRVGLRQWIAADLGKPFALMVDEIRTRFFNQGTDLCTILSDKTSDVAYYANYETDDGWEYRLGLGPMTRVEWFQRVKYEKNLFERTSNKNAETFENYKTTIPENLLYIDVDCFQKTLPASQLKERVAAFRKRSHDLITKLIQFCKG